MTHRPTRTPAPARPALIITASSLPPLTDAQAREQAKSFAYGNCRLCEAMRPDDPPASRLPVDFFDV